MLRASPAAFQLVTLGRLALAGGDGRVAGDSVAALGKQRRKLALLAVLAVEGRALSRDTLVEMFWGDRDEARARHSLSDAVSHLRQVLGRDAIAATRSEVSLAPEAALAVDARDLAAALAARDFGRAAALYGGPFLDGVYVDGSASFERWAERERTRLHGLFLRASRDHCAALARAGRWDDCAEAAARWLDAEPLSVEAALSRLGCLDRVHAPDAAARVVAEFDRLRARLAREFGLAPDPRVAALARQATGRLAAGRVDPQPVAEARADAPAPDATSGETNREPGGAAGVDTPSTQAAARGEAGENGPSRTARRAGPGGAGGGDHRTATPERGGPPTGTLTAAGPGAVIGTPPAVPLDAGRPAGVSADPPRAEPTAGRAPPPGEPASDGAAAGAQAAPRRPAGALDWAPARRWWVGAGTAAAVALLALASRFRPLTPAPASPTAVAVLPFAVHGSAEYAYLRSGMVDLLSATLDGAGAYRSVDPRAVVAATPARAGDVTPNDARAVAARVGAGLYVLGDVTAEGGRLRVTAALYDQRERRPVARATADGAPAALFELVDRLTLQLLAARPGVSADRLARSAALTTSSLAAAKAYLEGEAHYRAGRNADAFEAYQRAVAADTMFALAHYRSSMAMTWTGAAPWDSVVAASRRAVRHSARLSWRARTLVEGYDAWVRGAYDEAERHYRTVVGAAPDDVEAWFFIGEVLFHCNPFRGRSLAESRSAFERVLALEPAHRLAPVHLIRVAAYDGRRTELDSLLRRTAAATVDDQRTEWRAFRAFALDGPAAQDSALAELATARDEVVRRTADRVAVYAGDWDAAARTAALLTAAPRSRDARALGHVWLAELEIARGRMRAARTQLAAAAALSPGFALEHQALLTALPFLARPRAELSAVRDSLRRWDAAAAPAHDAPFLAVYNGLHPHVRLYLLGLLSARLGDTVGAAQAAGALERRNGASAARAFGQGLAESVRGHAAAARGDRGAALAAFERGRLTVWEGVLETTFGSQALERYARAELLREVGRDDEALAWYATIAQTSIDQLVYVAPAQLRQAEIHERRGRPTQAAEHYARFAALWAGADPELQPLVADARSRAARLAAAP